MMCFISQWGPFPLLFLAFWGIFAIAWYALVSFIKHNSNTPPGSPSLPLFGNLLCLDPQLHSYFASLSRTYGPIFSLRLSTKHSIVVSSPSMACQVLKDHDITFANRSLTVASRVAFYGGNDVLWTTYGSEWRIMLKKVFVQWILCSTTLDSVYTLHYKEVRKTVGYLYSQVGYPVDIGEKMYFTVLNVITNMIWSGMVEGDERAMVGAEFKEVVARMVKLLGKPNLSDFFP